MEDLIGSPIMPAHLAPAMREQLDAFEEGQRSRDVAAEGEGVLRMVFEAGGVAQYANIGNDRERDEELLEIVVGWLSQSRAAEN